MIKLKITGTLFLILLLFTKPYSFAQIPTTCFEIESILVDACGTPEGENEMVRFIVGPNDLNVANLNVVWPNGIYQGICQNAQTATKVTTLNTSVLSCGYLIEPTGGVLPAGSEVLMVTSTNMDPTFNSFANLSDTIIIIFQCAGNTAGHFKNYSAGSGFRTLVMDFGVGCSDTATYNVDSLIDQSGLHTAQDGASVSFTFAGADSYYNTGCQAPIVPLSATLTANQDTLCPGDTIQLSAVITGGSFNSFFWTGGKGNYGNALSFNTDYFSNNTSGGLDTLIFGIVGTCNDTVYDTLTVFIKIGGNLTLSASGPYVFCSGDSVTVTASGALNYLWSNGSTNASNVFYNSGLYTVTGFGSCGVDIDSVTVTVISDNQIALSLSGPAVFCLGDSVTLSVINGGFQYQWSTGASTDHITVYTSGNYQVFVTGICGIITLNQQVTVNSGPVLSLVVSDSVLCHGNTAILTASGGSNYLWSDGSTNATIAISNAGIYSVISSDACGSDTAFASISSSSLNAAFIADTTNGKAPLSVQFTNQSTGATLYNWDFSDGPGSTASDPDHQFNQPGSYLVTLVAEDANGCRDTAFIQITVVEDSISLIIPNIFTPNGDALNPYFNAKGTGIKSISGKVYNRWGTEIASWNSVQEGWDGKTKNGKESATGTYFYTMTVSFTNGQVQEKKGTITLVR